MTVRYSIFAFLLVIASIAAPGAHAAEMPKCNANAWSFLSFCSREETKKDCTAEDLKRFPSDVKSAHKNDCMAGKINGNQDIVSCVLTTDKNVRYQIVMDAGCDTLVFTPAVVH